MDDFGTDLYLHKWGNWVAAIYFLTGYMGEDAQDTVSFGVWGWDSMYLIH